MEKEPTFNYPWQEDAYGAYLAFQNGDMTFVVRDCNTAMYLFPEEPDADHVWIQLEEGEGEDRGIRLWRLQLDELLGKGSFSQLCSDLFERDFILAEDEEPSPLDMQAWEKTFKKDYERPDPIEKIVAFALKHFDAEAEYYLEHEWK